MRSRLTALANAAPRPPEGQDEDPTALTWADHFHIELADLAGNSVQTLFLRIITELWGRHRATQQRNSFGAEEAADVHTAHLRLVEAILDGDEGLAQHRMRRHLEALSAWWH